MTIDVKGQISIVKCSIIKAGRIILGNQARKKKLFTSEKDLLTCGQPDLGKHFNHRKEE